MSDVYDNKLIIYDLTIGLLLFLFIYANFPVISVLWDKWATAKFTGQFGHGPLLVLIVAWMIYREYKYNNYSRNTKISNRYFLLFIIAIISLLVFRLLNINFLEQIFLLASLVLFSLLFYTFEFVKRTKYAWLLLSLALPIWTFLNGPLQYIALHATNLLLSLTTIPYYTEDYLFHLPNGIFEVAESCSGLQQYLVSIILGLVYAYQRNIPFFPASMLLVYLSLFAIVINAIRIFIIVIIGYNTEMRSSLVEDHFTLGWVIYGVGIFVFFGAYNRLARQTENDQNTIIENESASVASLMNWRMVFLTLAVILLVYAAEQFLYSHLEKQHHGQLSYKILTDQATNKLTEKDNNLFTEKSFAQQLINEQLLIAGRVLEVNIARYTYIDNNIDPISEYTDFVDPKKWKLIKKDIVNVKDTTGKSYEVSRHVLRATNGQMRLIYKWYDINGKRTSDVKLAKLFLIPGIIRLEYDVKIIAMATELSNDHKSAEAFLAARFQELTYE